MKKMFWSIAICAAGLACFYIFFIDGTYRTPVQAIEQARHLDEPIEIVQEIEKGNGEMVFYLRYINRRNTKPVISADYTERTLMGWRWVSGGGHTLMETDDAMSPQAKLDMEWSAQWIPGEDGTPFPMLFGAVVNPDIAKVEVTDVKTGTTKPAKMINARPDMRIWYLLVDGSRGNDYTMQALSEYGHVLSTQQWNPNNGPEIREDGIK
ncbi:hypothetical protein MUG84_22230 [Paenibacillus sp. KQZ6P-2]|uniref:Uncharacterized protein n=1 Tax=Paenibacillus mangrovi TaxID=2931978 RepID=A0A9X1WTQ6_9BACL|nr:hypothetical protein [Paenibacillus mangrovi]MCJ8014421.1 hypothetical protein [Paenibacillus mangrovi]